MKPIQHCPECGAAFVPHHGAQSFCTPDHQRAFHIRSAQRGKIALPFVLTMRRGKKRGNDPNAAYAFRELCRMADLWTEQDKANGRRSELLVAKKARDGWSAVDLLG